jgi:hypothetical protein
MDRLIASVGRWFGVIDRGSRHAGFECRLAAPPRLKGDDNSRYMIYSFRWSSGVAAQARYPVDHAGMRDPKIRSQSSFRMAS